MNGDVDVVVYLRGLLREHDNWRRDESEFVYQPTAEDRLRVAAWEEGTGFCLPVDYVEASLRFAGFSFMGIRTFMVNEKPIWTHGNGEQILGAHVDESLMESVISNTRYVREIVEQAEEQHDLTGWRFDLVPIAGSNAFGLWCFDFRFDRENPPVVFLDSQSDWGGDRWSFPALNYVAATFTEFVLGFEYPDPEVGYLYDMHDPAERSRRELEWIGHRASLLGLR